MSKDSSEKMQVPSSSSRRQSGTRNPRTRNLPPSTRQARTTARRETVVPSKDDVLGAIMRAMTKAPVPVREPSPVPIQKSSLPPIYHTNATHIFSREEGGKIVNLLRSPVDRFEVEASLGTFKDKVFQPGVRSLYGFNNVKSNLEILALNGLVDESQDNTRVDSIEGIHVRRIFNMDSGDVIYQKKYRNRSNTVDNTQFGIRVTKSSEEYTNDREFEEEWRRKVDGEIDSWDPSSSKRVSDVAVQRYRRRFSYTGTAKDPTSNGLRFDLTSVEEIHIRNNGTTWRMQKYEVEIERVDQRVDIKQFTEVIRMILGFSQNNLCNEQLLDLKERRLAVQLHNNMFNRETSTIKWKPKDPHRLFSGYWNKPKNIKLNDMIDPRFNPAVTIKLNGRRNTLLIDRNGTYIYSPPYDVVKIGDGDEDLSGTMIDCEFMLVEDIGMKTIYGFDLLFYKGRDQRQAKFDTRLKFLVDVESEWKRNLYCDIEYKNKRYFQEGNFYNRTQQAFAEIASNPDYTEHNLQDGLILQPGNWYKNNHTFKWKPAKDLTIDFSIRRVEATDIVSLHRETAISPQFPWIQKFADVDEDTISEMYEGKIFWVLTGEDKGKEMTFHGSKNHPYPGYVIWEEGDLNNRIVECQWDVEKETFIPYRVRDDRDRPNNTTTAKNVWEDIMCPIPQATIEGNTLQVMRKFHNRQKLNLLTKEFSRGDVIIDIGSGRGGDLSKWDSVGFGHVYVVEPGDLKELNQRKIEGKYKTPITTLHLGAEKTKLIKSVVEKTGKPLNGIVSFFSLTFFPESREKYDGVIDTIDLLPDGGKFVGIVMDGYAVRDLLDEDRQDRNIDPEEAVTYNSNTDLEDSAFTIYQITEIDDNVIGNEIEIHIPNTMVENQTEWLFYFEPFKRELESRGFKLLSQGFIDSGTVFDTLPRQSEVFSALNRAFVFEKSVPTPPAPKIKDPSSSDMEKLSNKYADDLYFTGAQLDTSSFMHAILKAISPKYEGMNPTQRAEYALKIRQKLSQKLTQELFGQLHRGELAKRLRKPNVKKYGSEKATEIAHLEFKLKLMDNKISIGEVSMLELASKILGIDIYVLKGVDPIPSSKFAKECVDLYTHNKAVVLYTRDDIKYYLVVRKKRSKYYRIFDTSSPFIEKIRDEICG